MSAAGFVGRQSELRTLDERLIAARIGQPQVVFVEGDPGAGKSTLLSRFLRSVSGATVLEVAGDEDEALLAYGVVDQLTRGATEPGMDPMVVGARLLELLDPKQKNDDVTVLIVDDLQWVDRPSLRALLFALRRQRTGSILAVVSARAGELTEPGWARFLAGDSRVTRMRLGGLTSTDLTELARQLGLGNLTDRGASRLVEHTEGNALYCRALLDEIGVDGLSAAGATGLPAPRELSALILAHVGALAGSTQELLGAAAVLGQHGHAATIAAIAQLVDAEREVNESVGAGLLTAGPSGSELTFAHPLYRAAIYGDLSPMQRQGLHARAADRTEGRTRLAHLAAAAPRPDEALARQLDEFGRASAAAGDAGAAAWAMEQAATVSPDPQDRERRLLDAAVVLLTAADTPAAARVLASCQLPSPRRDAVTGLLGVFTGSPVAGDRLRAAWDGHDPRTETEIGARAATSLANWMVISGHLELAHQWADRAVAATVPGSALRAMARTAQAYALAADGRSVEGLARLEFLPAAADRVAIPETDALIMRGMLRLFADDLPAAIADLGVAAARLRTGLSSTYPVPCLAFLSEATFRRGDWDAAVAHAELATSIAQDVDRPLDLARAHSQSAQVLALRGHWMAAQAHVDAARAAAGRFPHLLVVAAATMAAATLASARGDSAGVLGAVEPLRATGLVGLGGLPGIFNWRPIEIDALIGLGRLADAERALEEFEAAIPGGGLASAQVAVARCRGNLAVALGEIAPADAAFERAHVVAMLAPMPFEQALLGLDDGRRLHIAGRVDAAVDQLQAAHRLFSDLGADPYVQACAVELAALYIPVLAESSTIELGLSRGELAVARLVAAGLTNREVAAQLFLSVKTVEYHLRNSYMKLNIASRKELVALLG